VVAVNMNKAFEVSRNHNGNNFAMVRYRAFLGGVRRSKLERSCATKKRQSCDQSSVPELLTCWLLLQHHRLVLRLGSAPSAAVHLAVRGADNLQMQQLVLLTATQALSLPRIRTFTQGAGQHLDVLPIWSGSYSGWTLREQRGQIRHLRSENHSL